MATKKRTVRMEFMKFQQALAFFYGPIPFIFAIIGERRLIGCARLLALWRKLAALAIGRSRGPAGMLIFFSSTVLFKGS
jgi:hypothetical protein